MMVQQTLTQRRSMKLDGMALGLEEQLTLPGSETLPFEDRVGLLVERELAHRGSRRLKRLLHKARLKHVQASLEDLDTRASRGLDAKLLPSLAHGEWIERGQTVLICGVTGVGKTWLTCALAQRACRLGKSAYYTRLPRLLEELRVARGEGTHKRRLAAIAKLDVLALDDWGLHALDAGDIARGSVGITYNEQMGARRSWSLAQLLISTQAMHSPLRLRGAGGTAPHDPLPRGLTDCQRRAGARRPGDRVYPTQV